MIWMKVKGVAIDQANQPVLLLVDQAETLALPIWIGTAEAQAIVVELQGVRMPRPMTHDLLRSVIQQLEAVVQRVVVSDVQNATYFASIHLQRNGSSLVVDSRPSDAIALALRMDAPIFVDEKVAAQGIVLKKPYEEHEMEEFRKFLDTVKPDDFGKP